MTAKEIILLKVRIQEELMSVQNLLSELKSKELLKTEGKETLHLKDDSFMLRAVGSIIHDFYVAVENVFEMISREIDESTPRGLNWHIELLKQMSLEIPLVRPAVITKETYFMLDKFRAFRHVFRNVYGFNLDTKRLKALLEELPASVAAINEDLNTFMNKMEKLVDEIE